MTHVRAVLGFIVAKLNEFIAIDPVAVGHLFDHRWWCNRQMTDHPHIQVGEVDPGNSGHPGGFDVGMLGLLNGILGPIGARIARENDDAGNLVAFRLLTHAEIAKVDAPPPDDEPTMLVRRKWVRVSDGVLHELLREGRTVHYEVIEGLPADARLVSVLKGIDDVWLQYASAEFDAVPDTVPLPELAVMLSITTIDDVDPIGPASMTEPPPEVRAQLPERFHREHLVPGFWECIGMDRMTINRARARLGLPPLR